MRFFAFLVALFFSVCTTAGFAADEFCDVYVGNEKVFAVSNTKILSALERGQLVNDTIQGVIEDSEANLDNLCVRVGMDGVPVIYLYVFNRHFHFNVFNRNSRASDEADNGQSESH